jgi:hypothetical protein
MDAATVIALVWAWMAEHPEHYCSYVNSFAQLRWSSAERRLVSVRVGGHWRRLANWARVVPTLNCVCHFERIVTPRHMCSVPRSMRQRWSEDERLRARRYRVHVFV